MRQEGFVMAQFRGWLASAVTSLWTRAAVRGVLVTVSAGALMGAGLMASASASSLNGGEPTSSGVSDSAPSVDAGGEASASTLPATATPIDAAVYNGSTFGGWKGNTTPLVSDGLSRRLRYVVVGKNGKTYESNYAATYGGGDLNLPNASIVDVDQMSSIAFEATFTNTTDADMTVDVTYWLPEAVRVGKSTTRDTDKNPRLVVSGAPTVTDADGATSSALTVTMMDQDSAKKGEDGQPVEVAKNSRAGVKGTLTAGQTVTLTIPLTLANADTLDMANTAGYSASYATTQELYPRVNGKAPASTWTGEMTVRFAHRMTVVTSGGGVVDLLADGRQYLGVTRERRDGATGSLSYAPVPEAIQKLMPAVDPSEAYTLNIPTLVSAKDYAGPTTHFAASASEDPALYSGGVYYIDTSRIKAALKDTGWSVNNLEHPNYTSHNAAGDVDHLSDVYAYQTWGKLNIPGSEGDDSLPLYVELYQYISTRDVTIHVGEDYDAKTAVEDSDEAASNHTLRFIKDYDGQPVAVSGATVTVDDSAVKVQEPGRYPVYYTYTPGVGTEKPDTVTAVAYVTVLAEPTSTPTGEPSTAPSGMPSSTPTGSPDSGLATGGSASDDPTTRPDDEQRSSASSLARTGASVLGVMAVAGVLIGAGVLLLRRRA